MSSAAPAPESTSLSEALGEAREQLSTEVDGGGEPGGEPGASDGARSDAEELIENATAEELEQIKRDPVLSKIYKSMVRDYKTKTTGVSEKKRQIEAREAELTAKAAESAQAQQLFDAMRDNPDEVIKAIATRRGMTITEARKAAVEAETDEELVELFGADAPAIQPAFDKAINKRVQAQIKPIMDHLNSEARVQLQRTIATDLQEFQAELKAKGETVTPEIEAEMDRLTKEIDPGPNTSNRAYIRHLYRIATSEKSKSEVTKEVVNRMERAVRDKEPREVPSGGAASGSNITEGMSLRESLAVARRDVRAGR